MVGNIPDAEDMAQDAMLKGFVRIRTLRDGARFGPWVAKIARRLCINLIGGKKRSQKAVARKVADANQSVTRNDNLQQAIEKLPQGIRLPLVMYYFGGQSVEAVAETLGMSSSSVYLKLRTAVKELHNLLVSQGEAQ